MKFFRQLLILGGLGLGICYLFGMIFGSTFGLSGDTAKVYATPKLKFIPVFNHSFNRPVALTHPPQRSKVIGLEGAFIAEQTGKIWRVTQGKVVEFIDLSKKVRTRNNEEGLLGLVHAPNFPNDPRLFIYYSASRPQRSVIAELTLNSEINAVIEFRTLLEVPQPYGNHNGGALVIGPDQHLYVGLGDGGAGGDPHGHGQNRSTLLGSILRLDISHVGEVRIPRDNPFVNQTDIRPEIWAYGLRNPWRMSFDRKSGALWVGDVGQERYEEVNLIHAGDNLGWKWREGHTDYQDRHALDHTQLTKKVRQTLIDPIAVYDHHQGMSITGGYVYRGDSTAQQGQYLYADFVTGRVWSLDADQATLGKSVVPTLLAQVNLNIASFAEDQRGEIYALCFDGIIYRLDWSLESN